MKETDGSTRGRAWGLALCLAVGGSVPTHAQAQAAETASMPRTLEGGAPERRLPAHGVERRRSAVGTHRAAKPAITLDARNAAALASSAAYRSEALLQREVALLSRLIAHMTRDDPRRPDALMRPAIAYEEQIWLERQRLHRLQTARSATCSCRAKPPRTTADTAIATRATAPDAVVALLHATSKPAGACEPQ